MQSLSAQVVAVLSVCVTLPMVYNYVHHVKRTMHGEIAFCKVWWQSALYKRNFFVFGPGYNSSECEEGRE